MAKKVASPKGTLGRITKYDEIITDFVRRLCTLKGWSQDEFAHEIGVSKSLVSMAYSGQRSWTFATLQKIEECIGVSPAEILSGISSSELALFKAVKAGVAAEEKHAEVKSEIEGSKPSRKPKDTGSK